jgi:hypothetical protein
MSTTEHEVLAGKDARREPVGQLARDAAPLEVVEVFAVGHESLLVR